MQKSFQKRLSIIAICLLFAQTLFGSLPAFAQTTSKGQSYVGNTVATNPVTIQGATTSADSAAIQTTTVTTPASTTIYVNQNSAGPTEDGISWDTAYKDLQVALTKATYGNEIWIAEGTYKPTTPTDSSDPRTASFKMKNGVAIYGGFEGVKGETITGRDFENNKTILSGDIGTLDVNSDNSYHVFYHDNLDLIDKTAILDGVTITGGNADGSVRHSNGGGMFNEGGNLTLSNVIFSENKASSNGGGMYNTGDNLTLTDVEFSKNEFSSSSNSSGGGMYNTGNNLTLTNVEFSENRFFIGSLIGGGMYNTGSNLTLTNVEFRGNEISAVGLIYGGGMYNGGSNLTLTDVEFSQNKASSNLGEVKGGGMYNGGSNLTLTDVEFSGNEVSSSSSYPSSGGGMYNSGSSLTLTDVEFSGNEVSSSYPSSGGGMYNYNSSPTLTNVIFSGNLSSSGGGMYNYDNSSPTLTNVTVSGNTTNGGNQAAIYNQSNGSTPIIRNSIIVGNNGPAFDGDGTPSIEHSLIGDDTTGKLYDGMGRKGDDDYKVEDIFINPNPALPAKVDYRLKEESPAIGKGFGYSELASITEDVEGNSRIQEETIDLGAYESPHKTTEVMVTFNLDGGTGKLNAMVMFNSPLPSIVIPTKQDYIFDGWYKDKTFTSAYMNDPVKANITLFAKWTNPTYLVSYNGNGATGGQVPGNNSYEEKVIVTVAANSGNLEKTGFTFTGWNTQADGKGTHYAVNDTFKMGATNVTLYAKWTVNPTYTVSYDGNGETSGKVPGSNNYEEKATVTIAANSGNLEKIGFTFAGWNTQADGKGTHYAANDTFKMGATNVTLYAEWTANPTYTVSYNGNGATGGQVPGNNSYEEKVIVTVAANSGNLEKTGFTFAGWNSQADGKGTHYAVNDTFKMGATNVTLYAEWTANPTYTVSYNGNGA
ncbi:InlB B-repeat-containing protein, partial [Solibacillus cecembensis]|uniref:InlB B-repeat-containing protein n=1 Tax=Solibacillus cecembensis TaxID=459347 RepID=UPI003CFE0278